MDDEPPRRFDPVWGAWILLLGLLVAVFLNSVFLFVGCAVFHEPTICARTGNNLRDVTLELITALAILVSQRR